MLELISSFSQAQAATSEPPLTTMENLLIRNEKKALKVLIPQPGLPTAAPVHTGTARGGSQSRCGSQATTITPLQQTVATGGGTNHGTVRRPQAGRRGGSSHRPGDRGSRGGGTKAQGTPNRGSQLERSPQWCRYRRDVCGYWLYPWSRICGGCWEPNPFWDESQPMRSGGGRG
jgi:hypothetical protein